MLAIKSLRGNLVRTALTILGMVIGIGSVIVVYSAGEGISGLVLGQVETFGTNIIQTEVRVPVTKKGMAKDNQSGAAMAQGVQVTTLKIADMEDVKKLPNVATAYAGILSQEQVSYGNELRKSFLFGTSASYIDVDVAKVEFGRFYTEEEDKSHAMVAVLGYKMKDKLFGDHDPLGESIKIHGKKFRVIGVMEKRGGTMGMDFDDYIYLPVRTLQKRIMGIDHILYFVTKVKNLDQSEDTAEEMRAILRANHDITDPIRDDFRVATMAEMLDILGTVTGAITLLLLAIVVISLVVGGVGIMNIMYVVVSERTAEIGLRKAVGAKYGDIMRQFLLEAIIITLAGGVAGIIFGVVVSVFIYFGANSFGLDWPFAIPLKAFTVSLGFSAFFGLIFGIYPARQAARLEPIEALRKE